MPATKILWLPIIIVALIMLLAIWGATEWTAWSLGFQDQLGLPWYRCLGLPVYNPLAFFWWWYFTVPTPHQSLSMAHISPSRAVFCLSSTPSVWRVREAKNVETYGSAC